MGLLDALPRQLPAAQARHGLLGIRDDFSVDGVSDDGWASAKSDFAAPTGYGLLDVSQPYQFGTASREAVRGAWGIAQALADNETSNADTPENSRAAEYADERYRIRIGQD